MFDNGGDHWFVMTGVNASYLGKQNSIPPMFRVIQQCGRKHTAILKLALDILTNLTKSSNSLHSVPLFLSVSSFLYLSVSSFLYLLGRSACLNQIITLYLWCFCCGFVRVYVWLSCDKASVLSGNNAARTIGGEHVPHLLSLYHEWHQLDTKHRHINLRKALLNILKNITNLRKSPQVTTNTAKL